MYWHVCAAGALCLHAEQHSHVPKGTSLKVCVQASEGLDFKDNHARGVIAIGIPFPNLKDRQVNPGAGAPYVCLGVAVPAAC